MINGEATKEAFLRSAHNYRILHLATHGQADVRVGDYSSLFFHASDTSAGSEKLYAGELYNLQLNSDLVVLSACETGLGEWRRGEGIISLARAFSYAGAKSIVSSLWKVEDSSTSRLMAGFYKYLRSGMTKSQALRRAKLEYFARSPNVEPFYWAGFIPTGDMSPIPDAGMGRSYLYFLLALLGSAVLAFLAIRKRG